MQQTLVLIFCILVFNLAGASSGANQDRTATNIECKSEATHKPMQIKLISDGNVVVYDKSANPAVILYSFDLPLAGAGSSTENYDAYRTLFLGQGSLSAGAAKILFVFTNPLKSILMYEMVVHPTGRSDLPAKISFIRSLGKAPILSLLCK